MNVLIPCGAAFSNCSAPIAVIIDLFAEWRVAARTATVAERVVSNTYRRFFQGVGEPPTSESIAEAQRKRNLADDLFIVAMGSYQAERKP